MKNLAASSILIVEDERIVARDLQETLRDLGYDAFAIATSADEAIVRASQRCPDVVLMDIRIKGQRDGIEAADILRREFGVPVVFLTAHADDATIERAKRVEPHGYLMKPVREMELRCAIEVALYRHEMEKRLRERERWFSTTLRSIADAVVMVDLAGNITFMNPVAETLTNTTLASALGRPAREVLRLVDTETGVRAESPLDDVLRQHKAVFLREALLQTEGQPVCIISDSTAPVLDDGQMLGAVMVFRDITQQKLIQKQLELSDRLASLGTMAAGVAHEVNNPLAVIVMNASIVATELTILREQVGALPVELTNDSGRRFDEALLAQQDLQAAANRIGTIISDLKIFSRPVEQVAGTADIARTIDQAVRSVAFELQYRAEVVMHLVAVPNAQVDETRLTQVLVNLLINAGQSICPGHPGDHQITVSTHADSKGQIVIEVRDTGAGIPPAVLAHIFEPFFTTKPVGVGTGLGLSICHGIVKSMGGNISIESEVGKGTVVRLSLPPVILVPSRLVENRMPATLPTRRGRILVVDDETMILRTIGRVLKHHSVVCSSSVPEALDYIATGEPFDVILSDVMMPHISGIQFYETLLGRSPDLARRIVFLTGGALTSKTEDFLRSVNNHRIEKPFSNKDLVDVVGKLVEEAAVRNAAA